MSLVDPLPQSPTVCHDGLDGLHGISPKLDTGRRRKKKISPVALWSSRREREQQASKSVRSWKLDTKRDGLSTTLPALGLGLSGDRRPATVQPGSGQRTRQRRMRHDVRRRRSPKRGAEKQGPSVFMVHPKVQLGGEAWGKTLFVATHGGGGGGGHFSFSDE